MQSWVNGRGLSRDKIETEVLVNKLENKRKQVQAGWLVAASAAAAEVRQSAGTTAQQRIVASAWVLRGGARAGRWNGAGRFGRGGR